MKTPKEIETYVERRREVGGRGKGDGKKKEKKEKNKVREGKKKYIKGETAFRWRKATG